MFRMSRLSRFSRFVPTPMSVAVTATLALTATQGLAQTPATTPAPAAQATEGADSSQTIVVTARRSAERIIDVPLSVKALTGRDLQDRGVSSISDLSLFTPGLSYSPDLGRVAERPVIRGISALRPEAPQPVSVFIDGIFVRDAALGLALDDAQQVEVIKGPQSALYGRSTYAGAINYITVKPGNEFKGKASFTMAQADEVQAFAAVSVPLMKDLLGMRVRAKTYQFGGQYTNTLTGNKTGGERTDALGVSLALTPTQSLSVLLGLDHYQDNDGYFNGTVRTVPTQSPPGTVTSQNDSSNVANGTVCNGRTLAIVGNNAVTGLPDPAVPATATTRANGWPCGAATFSGTAVRRNEADLANYTDPSTGINYGNIAGLNRSISRTGLTVNYEFMGGYTLTSQTGYTRQRANLGADQSYNGTRFAITGSSWTSYDRDELEYVSQELRLASPDNQPLTWLVGLFYYDEESRGQSSGVIRTTAPGTDPLRPKSTINITNSAPFARVQYDFGATRVSLEGRQNKEKIDVDGRAASAPSGSQTFTDFSPRLTLDFKPSPDTLVYVQGATGSKSGGFNTTAGLPPDLFTFRGEKVKSAEVGFKGVLMGGRLGFSAALFRNNIADLQLSNIVTYTSPTTNLPATVTVVNNVGKARTQGLEFDLSMRATDWLTLTGNYAFTDAKAVEGTETTNGTAFGGNRSVAGFELPRSPKHSAALSAALGLPVGTSGMRFNGRVDVVYQSRRYAEIQNLIWADPFTHINLSTGLSGKDWSVKLWMKNATNDNTSLNGFRYLDPATFRRSAVDFLPRLRQTGVTAAIDF